MHLKPHRFHCLRFLSRSLLAMLVMMGLATGHPNHDAIAEVDWNSETGSLEVELRVNAHELERAVSKLAGQALDLDEAGSLEHLKKYVAAHVRCLDEDGKAVEMKWAGAEIRVRSAWLYFEFPVGKRSDEAVAKCSIANTVFFEDYEDQTNTVAFRLRSDGTRCFIRYSKEKPIASLTPEVEPKADPLNKPELTTEE
ncbi:MAG: hypothetical protein O3C21_11940 [Verrucomicrobia bacterium]|nr:hypothetical protein [Verrucomicrobiota bacterium]